MNPKETSTPLARLTSALTLRTRTEVGRAMRPRPGGPGDPKQESYYIEAGPDAAGVAFSCSFVEFDGMGDYLLFEQHQHAWQQVRSLAEERPVLLVIYCHGWKNNSQSGDVLRFNAFLRQLASTPSVREQSLRVHGVYLAWRGAFLKPDLSGADDVALAASLCRDFKQPIVDPRWAQWLPSWSTFISQQLTYWGRKTAAERDVSGAPISRTIYSLGYLLQRQQKQQQGHRHRVVLIGHSMGALILEQSLANASLSKVMADWPWFEKGKAPQPAPGHNDPVLPFDLVLLLNSAAPSIYAKEMRDFLAADYSARRRAGLPRPDLPIMISVTSEADRATGVVHPIGNALALMSPKMQRQYRDANSSRGVLQGSFYFRTPGHNPLLINRKIVPAQAPPPETTPFEKNMRPNPAAPWTFYTSAREPDKPCLAWQLVRETPARTSDSTLGETYRDKANYWIVRAPGDLIRNHVDIWSQQCMEMMVALWRMSGTVSEPRTAQEHRARQAGSPSNDHGS
jgi:hypothetical protein